MNWSDYSRFVGDVFGAPLAIEGLLAFFLESHVPRPVDLRVGQAPPRPARRLHVARAPRHAVLVVVHPGRQLVDAAPGRLPLQPRHRPRRADRLLGGDVQQGAAGDLPARDHGGVHDRGRLRGGRRRLPLHEEEARARPRALPPRDPHRRRRHPARRPRRRDHRRPPGQGHDRGAADEDGRRRGSLRDRARAARRSPSSPSAPPTARRRSSPSRSPACCPSSAPARSTARCRASTRCARSTSRSTATTRRPRPSPRATTSPSSR